MEQRPPRLQARVEPAPRPRRQGELPAPRPPMELPARPRLLGPRRRRRSPLVRRKQALEPRLPARQSRVAPLPHGGPRQHHRRQMPRRRPPQARQIQQRRREQNEETKRRPSSSSDDDDDRRRQDGDARRRARRGDDDDPGPSGFFPQRTGTAKEAKAGVVGSWAVPAPAGRGGGGGRRDRSGGGEPEAPRDGRRPLEARRQYKYDDESKAPPRPVVSDPGDGGGEPRPMAAVDRGGSRFESHGACSEPRPSERPS
mmetsp:Transcript_10573/g.34918  ORF Transcript_10573/g.34918 Transcript_10573/m.34918 type:complete len:256 (+) Transcript_10573:1242-2009(+)